MNFNGKSENEAKAEILELVKEYCDTYHNKNKWSEGKRISYASRVYDSEEMTNLVDSALEFWLTAGRYTDEFEKNFAKYLGVRYCSLVNSGSSANLIDTTKLPETVSETIPAPRKPVHFLLFLSPAGSQFLAVDTLFSRIS